MYCLEVRDKTLMMGCSRHSKKTIFLLYLHNNLTILYIDIYILILIYYLKYIFYGTAYVTKENSSCFLSNPNNGSDFTVKFGGIDYFLPAWSVTILPDCKNEAYNTAKVYV